MLDAPPRKRVRPGAWFWLSMVALSMALAGALAAVCMQQVERAEARRLMLRVQDMVFGHCLDQMGNLTISRCRERFAREH